MNVPGDYLSTCRKSFGQPGAIETSSSRQLFPRVFELATLSTSLQANKSQTKATKITSGAGSGPCCYARIPYTSAKCSHSHGEVSFRKQNKLET
jgi:hypothetical protein